MSGLIYGLIFLSIILVILAGNSENESAKSIKKTFGYKWANKLHELSYWVPFVWFIDEKEEGKQARQVKAQIAEANLGDKFNYRSFTTLKVGMVIGGGVVYALMSFVIEHSAVIMNMLFNLSEVQTVGNSASSTQNMKTMLFMALLVACLLPNIVLRKRSVDYKMHYLKDIPIIQLFIILMLKSKKPLNEVLFALSKVNSRYRGVFETGYRIYLRDKSEGLSFIQESFTGTKFSETIEALQEYGKYSREDTIKLLENNMEQIVEQDNANKRRRDLSSLVYSQATIAIPFVAIIALCLVPVAVYGIQIFENAGMGGFM